MQDALLLSSSLSCTMPSVRVRRRAHTHSEYAHLHGDDGNDTPRAPQTVPTSSGRPRSRTLASMFSLRAESPHERQITRPGSQSSSPSATRRMRPMGKVAQSIMKTGSHIRPLGRENLSRSPTGENEERDGMVLLHGSQLDIAVHNEDLTGVLGSSLSLASHMSSVMSHDDEHHADDIVENLDVIDPRIATISSLANAANAILIPPIGIYSRKPVVVLPKGQLPRRDKEKGGESDDELDRHVEDVLSRKQQFRRIMQGVWAFLKTPMGIVVGIYGFLVVFWGTAIVLFLLKWINVHNPVTQGFWLEISQQIVNVLFTLTGVGLLPWRIVDTYRGLRIWHYKRLTRRLRAAAGLPTLYDEDDLPDPIYDPNHVHVLTEAQQHDLHYQQEQFMKSQTWYRAHGTATHRAFPINMALMICLSNDGNSIFQIMLCGTMWGLNRFDRPAWTTGCLIGLAFTCGIMSGVLIWRGGQRTKRTKEVEERLRTALAMEKYPSGEGKKASRTQGNDETETSFPNSSSEGRPSEIVPRLQEDVESSVREEEKREKTTR